MSDPSPYTSGTYTLDGLLTTVTATVVTDATVTFNLFCSFASDFKISSAAGSTVVVNDTFAIGDVINLDTNGGTISAGSGLLLDDVNANIDGGGDYVVSPSCISILSVSCDVGYTDAAGGTMTLGTAGSYGATSEGAALTGWTTVADKVDDQSLSFGGITGYTVSGAPSGVQTIVIDSASGSFTWHTSDAGLADGSYAKGAGQITLTEDASGGTMIYQCFLAGTHLETPHGETRVEALRAGDLVATRSGGETTFRPVAWIGRRAMDVAAVAHPASARPVRIRAGAFAPNVPHRDLLVTGEHCVFVDGRLIPARMLVNGASIVADAAIRSYEYFHIELETHSILVSEGLETESYLDTGNRGNFANAPAPALRPDLSVEAAHAAWATRAAAPLAVDRETVEPIWRRLAQRAGADLAASAAAVADPDLRLVTDAGVEIRPSIVDGAHHAFVIPGGTRTLRLVSHAARPSDAVGPYLDDRRVLGVLVGRIGLGIGRRRIEADAVGFAGAPSGWHAPEAGSRHRWTDGDAALPIDLSACKGAPAFLSIEVASVAPCAATEVPLAA